MLLGSTHSLVSKSSLVVVVLGLLHLEMDTVFDMNAILEMGCSHHLVVLTGVDTSGLTS